MHAPESVLEESDRHFYLELDPKELNEWLGIEFVALRS
jgi:hypothetical protein